MTVQTFTEWQGQPLEEMLYQCRELVEDIEFPTVRRWREAGGKVVGHFQVYFPEEIAHAAGMLPKNDPLREDMISQAETWQAELLEQLEDEED